MSDLTWLSNHPRPHFPPIHQALTEPNGLLAVGGHLTPEWLITAYQQGIFPWYTEDEPILWWSPAPRCVFTKHPPILNARMRRWLRRQHHLTITLDTDFAAVINACAQIPRAGQAGTWIHPEMQAAYHALFQMGYATAIAVWDHNDLIGGLYGVSIGQMLYGESMFSARTGGSKIALAAAQWLMQQQVWQLIDAQVVSPHLLTLGAQAISREAFISSMTAATAAPKVNRQEIFSNEACLDALIRTDAT